MYIHICQLHWVLTQQRFKWMIEIYSQWIDLSFWRLNTMTMIETARKEKSWNAHQEMIMCWRLWEALSSASLMIQPTQKHCNKAHSILLREILFHWLWLLNWLQIFKTKSRDSCAIWTQLTRALIVWIADWQIWKILSIIYNRKWRQTTTILQLSVR